MKFVGYLACCHACGLEHVKLFNELGSAVRGYGYYALYAVWIGTGEAVTKPDAAREAYVCF